VLRLETTYPVDDSVRVNLEFEMLTAVPLHQSGRLLNLI